MTKQFYYRIITILGSIILLLIVFIASLLMNPRVETQIVEVLKEVIVEKKIEVPIEVPVETEVFIETIKEVPVIKEVFVETEPTYVYNVSSKDRELLARVVHLESDIESLECQKAVASVVINRWQNGYWGDSLKDVIYAPNQFAVAPYIKSCTPNEKNYEAVDYVLRYGCTIPEYVMYFRASYHFNWTGYVPYQHIDNTYFGYNEYDKK